LPGDIFAPRPMVSHLEHPTEDRAQGMAVADCFKPVSRHWERIYRPEQLLTSLPEAMRVLVSAAQTGVVTLAVAEHARADAWDYPASLFERRVWVAGRPRPDRSLLDRAVGWIRKSENPMIVAGGGVLYSEATSTLEALTAQTGIAVAETRAGKGAMHHNHVSSLGTVGVNGSPAANRLARDADLVIGVGTRFSDVSKMDFANPNVRFIHINISEFDAHERAGLELVGDARACLEELVFALDDWGVSQRYAAQISDWRDDWNAEVERIYDLGHGPLPSQGEIMGVVNRLSRDEDAVICDVGSLPADLHKLWKSRDPNSYHMEPGYARMGYALSGALGVKMADPDREVTVLAGEDGWLKVSQDLVTAIRGNIKLTVVVVRSMGERMPVDYAGHAVSLGAHADSVQCKNAFEKAFRDARSVDRVSVIVVDTDGSQRVPVYESWGDDVSEAPLDNPDGLAPCSQAEESVAGPC